MSGTGVPRFRTDFTGIAMILHNSEPASKKVAKIAPRHLFFFMAFFCSLLASPLQAAPEILARVNGVPITDDDLRWAMYTDENDGTVLSFEAQKTVLDQLINRELLYQDAVAHDIAVSEDDVRKKRDRMVKSYKTTYRDFAEKLGLSDDDITLAITKDLAIAKRLHRELPRITDTSTEEAKAYFEENPQDFVVDGAVRVRHILIKLNPDADESEKEGILEFMANLKEELQNGAVFADLARMYSQCPSRIKGGDVGFVNHGQKYAAFEAAAFSLAPGEISDVIETPLGYHLLTVTERKPAVSLGFDKVEKPLKHYLKEEKKQAQVQNFLHALKSKPGTRIEVLGPTEPDPNNVQSTL